MRAKISSQIINAFASLLSGVLLFLAFPDYDYAWLAWVGLAPLLIVLHRQTLKSAFLWSHLCGIVFFAGIFNWILEVPGYKLHHHAILIPYLGLYFGLFGWGFSYIRKHWNPAVAAISAPFLWITLEYVRSSLSFLALPWALLAHSQYQNTSSIQIASLTGAYGVSFLIVAVNSALAQAIAPFLISFEKSKRPYYRHPSKRTRIAIICLAALVFIAAYLFGHLRVAGEIPGHSIRVAVVQGNISREQKRNLKKNGSFIMQRHKALTIQAAAGEPELIVWPEAATPGYLMNNSLLMHKMTSLIKQIGVHFLVGSAEHAKFTGATKDKSKTGNTALYFSPDGKIIDQYLKIHLVPFGEVLPYQNIITWPDFIVPKKKYFEIPGTKYTLFELDDARFGVVICWEIVFPGLFRTFVENGANFMLNITNEGWFGAPALYQMVAISVYRAVENRVSLARAANTGISCFIDPFGRITGRVSNTGQNILIEGTLSQNVQLSNKRTFYNRFGDLFACLCIAVSLIIVLVTFIKSRK